jgi:hypothetical protein
VGVKMADGGKYEKWIRNGFAIEQQVRNLQCLPVGHSVALQDW